MAGYSDATMLHMALSKLGIKSLLSTMPVSFFDTEGYIDRIGVSSLVDALNNRPIALELAPHHLNQKGSAKGRLWGGNLSLVYSAAGTPEDNDMKQGEWILLIEDVGEYMYHLDRMMQNLYHSGKLSRVRAIIVGYMSDMKQPEMFGSISAEELISEYTRKYDIPVIFGIPSGHQQPNCTLVLGDQIEVTVTEQGAKIRSL